ncbi:GNAT family N-acetyltransferase [Pseudomonadota bacterium]
MLWQFSPLEFESGVFGAPVGRVVPANDGAELAQLKSAWLETSQWLVSARIAVEDQAAEADLRGAGFTAIESLVTLHRALAGATPTPDGVRLVREADVESCLDIARTAFVHDRFHADPRVPDRSADLLKEVWVRNSLEGRADAVLVAQVEGAVAGFVTCMVTDAAAAIDLIAVAPGHQGQGIGKRLVRGALAHYAGDKALMRVGTQDTNDRSLALYESQDFTRAYAQMTFHWINEEAGP